MREHLGAVVIVITLILMTATLLPLVNTQLLQDLLLPVLCLLESVVDTTANHQTRMLQAGHLRKRPQL